MQLITACLVWLTTMAVMADVFPLADGKRIDGTYQQMNDNGVLFVGSDGSEIPRVPWDNLTQEALRTLYEKARKPGEKAMIEPLLEEPAQAKAERKEIVVKPIVPPERPVSHLGMAAIFSSPVGWFIILVLYGATLFAAYEVAVYRRRPVATVMGLAAVPFLGVLSPIIYLAMPAHRGPMQIAAEDAQTRFHETAPPADVPAAAPAAAPETQVEAEPVQAAAVPEPVVFKRTEYSFNRRFFETRLAGFLRVVPSDAEKDLWLTIRSARGEFTGRRILRITPAELYFQVAHENGTTEEMIPFLEVTEVLIRHKDLI